MGKKELGEAAKKEFKNPYINRPTRISHIHIVWRDLRGHWLVRDPGS